MKPIFLFLILSTLLTACGYKGDLYLPYKGDKARYGSVQTGIDFKKTDSAVRNPNKPTTHTEQK